MAANVAMAVMTKMYLDQHNVTTTSTEHPVFLALADAMDLTAPEFQKVLQRFEVDWRNVVLDTLENYVEDGTEIPEWAAKLDEKKATKH